jgi:hypothetical protein
MRDAGYVIHWSNKKGQGMIHMGGRSHSGLLGLALADCDAKLKAQLERSDIPSGAAVRVQFGVAIRDGGLAGAPVSLFAASRPSREKSKKRSKSRRRS